jgi:hypothetical protein
MSHRLLRGAAAIAALVLAANAPAAGGCPPKSEQVDVTVSDGKITSPAADSTVTIYQDETKGKGKVCWVISGLSEVYALNFVTKDESTASLTFDKGKAVKGTSGGNDMRVGVPDKGGRWHYAIVLQKGGADVQTLDPEVQIVGK